MHPLSLKRHMAPEMDIDILIHYLTKIFHAHCQITYKFVFQDILEIKALTFLNLRINVTENNISLGTILGCFQARQSDLRKLLFAVANMF